MAMDNGKYVRYTPEQVEVLERLYYECPKPGLVRRQQLIREYPILSNIEPKQIKVLFQNRRLQKQVSQLVHEKSYFRRQTRNGALVTTDTSCDSVVTSGHHQQRHLSTPQYPPPRDASPAGLVGNETLTEFLSKATGIAVEWVQMPGMKPGPDSIGIVAISHGCTGVAARACGLVGLDPSGVSEILKDRPSWCRDCRAMDVMNVLSTGTCGTIELLYMQLYAPTTLAPARDFWLLRYTSVLEDGGLVVCERSLNNTQNGPEYMQPAASFVRAEMLPSGYLIRPCEGGGSIIHIVDHMDLEAWRVPEVLRPLYESSTLLAQKTKMAALRHLRQISQEISQPDATGWGRRPAPLRALSQKLSRYVHLTLHYLVKLPSISLPGWVFGLSEFDPEIKPFYSHSHPIQFGFRRTSPYSKSDLILNQMLVPYSYCLCMWQSKLVLLSRGFNEAVNGFPDEGWSVLESDGVDDITLLVNSSPGKMMVMNLSYSNGFPPIGNGVLCAKASTLLQNVPPAILLRFLREHRSDWADGGIGAYSAAAVKAGPCSLRMSPGGSFGGQVILPLTHTIENEDFTEVIKLENIGHYRDHMIMSGNIFLLQLCGGVDENAVGSCSELIFAPIDASFSDDALIIPSVSVSSPSIPECMSVVSSPVQRVASAFSPSDFSSHAEFQTLPDTPEAQTLARWICQSYRCFLGMELLKHEGSESILKNLWHQSDAILCCSLKAQPVFIFSNQAGLDMLETTLVALQDISLEKTFDENGRKALFAELPQVMQQVGICDVDMLKELLGFDLSEEEKERLTREVTVKEITNSIFCQGKIKPLIDLRKAFDSVNWDFLLGVLEALGLPLKFQDLVGFFGGAKSIRQGDPLSPLLFVLAMNVLSKLLDVAISNEVFRQVILPSAIIKRIDKLCIHYFWKGKDSTAGGAWVSWKLFCSPKSEGGLGLKEIRCWNRSCMFFIIMKIFAGSGLAWIQACVLRGDNFWGAQKKASFSWSLQKLLDLREDM
ncbi:Homeobox-leucine zipper protein HOX29 [Hibiscus syriacus]|uniref:Homeobox-leucine zipper protein HOX29 n=1 Tax=Hibiscus syriacus TaxID=106335 RepID=A0A6A2XL45_HIBSY|nr:Homeobox-leucine zipper protein HOX29 [Hibiscus syriacus]